MYLYQLLLTYLKYSKNSLIAL